MRIESLGEAAPSNNRVFRNSQRESDIPGKAFRRLAPLFLATLARVVVCPGDDILAITAPVAVGANVSDVSRGAVLPSPMEIICRDEKKGNKKQNPIFPS